MSPRALETASSPLTRLTPPPMKVCMFNKKKAKKKGEKNDKNMVLIFIDSFNQIEKKNI